MKAKYDFFELPCLCGSGKLYKECCKKKINISEGENIFKSFMQEFDKVHNRYKKICMHPKQEECSSVRTHAHTISQKAVLDLIAKDGKVLMPIVFGINNEFRMEPVGVEAKATKFYCFCSVHDGMFAPIDRNDIMMDEYTNFLYAYRIFASTYYKMERELGCYNKLKEKYDFTSNPQAILTYKQMEKNLSILDKIKKVFDVTIITEDYNVLESVKVQLEYKTYFAAATCFCPMIDLFGNMIVWNENELPLIYLSIIPDKKSTNIIFSWLKKDSGIYSFFAEQISHTPTRLLLKYLNNLVPLNCENIVVSPILWEKWNKEGQDDFVEVAYEHLKNANMKYMSKEYFAERSYNLFLKVQDKQDI